jgi:hypothetical protein
MGAEVNLANHARRPRDRRNVATRGRNSTSATQPERKSQTRSSRVREPAHIVRASQKRRSGDTRLPPALSAKIDASAAVVVAVTIGSRARAGAGRGRFRFRGLRGRLSRQLHDRIRSRGSTANARNGTHDHAPLEVEIVGPSIRISTSWIDGARMQPLGNARCQHRIVPRIADRSGYTVLSAGAVPPVKLGEIAKWCTSPKKGNPARSTALPQRR